jgi:dihydropteroate synthase
MDMRKAAIVHDSKTPAVQRVGATRPQAFQASSTFHPPPVTSWRCGRHTIALDRPRIMGILNITPDSFSDGGQWLDPDAAVRHGVALAAEGADILDVGGESTRPGAAAVPADEEARRVVPVIAALVRQVQVPISVDTRKAAVARAALDAGASIVNDVTALADPAMAALARDSGAGVVLMHMRGTPETMQQAPQYKDVVAEVQAFLAERVAAAVAAGIGRERIVVDPGIGFGKTTAHNLALLGALARLAEVAPVLVGASRKRFIGEITGAPAGARLPGSLAAALWSLRHGAALVRVHDVAATRAALAMEAALAAGGVVGA